MIGEELAKNSINIDMENVYNSKKISFKNFLRYQLMRFLNTVFSAIFSAIFVVLFFFIIFVIYVALFR